MPNCTIPNKISPAINFPFKSLNLKNGRNTRNEISIRMKETKFESRDVKFDFINPNEKAHIKDVMIRKIIYYIDCTNEYLILSTHPMHREMVPESWESHHACTI